MLSAPSTAVNRSIVVPTVLMIDDDLAVAGLAGALLGHGVHVSGCPGDDPVLCAQGLRPHLALVEIRRPGTLACIGPLRRHVSRVVVLTDVSDRLAVATAIEASADDVIDRRAGLYSVALNVLAVLEGAVMFGAACRAELLDELRSHRREASDRLAVFASLTVSERRALAGLVQGRAAEEIAAEQCKSVATIRTHINAVFGKLGVHSQVAAVARAISAGWPEVHDEWESNSR
jgi:DNA-binding NarL/FixJ family response regulator